MFGTQQLFHQLCVTHLDRRGHRWFQLEAKKKLFPVAILYCLRDVCGWNADQRVTKIDDDVIRMHFLGRNLPRFRSGQLDKKIAALFDVLEEASCFVKEHLIPYVKTINK